MKQRRTDRRSRGAAYSGPATRWLILAGALAGMSGCAAGTGSATQRQTEDAAPIDPQRAFLRLSDIQPSVSIEILPPCTPTPGAAAESALAPARTAFNDGRWAEAIRICETLLSRTPDLLDARVLAIRAALRQGDQPQAESFLTTAGANAAPSTVLLPPCNSVAVLQSLGELAWRANDPQRAIRLFRMALLATDAGPGRPETVLVHIRLAMALRQEGYLTAAAGQMQAYLAATENPSPRMQADPELVELMELYRGRAAGLMGEMLTQLDHHAEAAAAYRRAVAEMPNDPLLLQGLAMALSRAGSHDEAIQTARQFAERGPDFEAGLALLEMACKSADQPQRVGQEFEGLASAMDDAARQERIGSALMDRGDVERAMRVLDRLVARRPERIDASIRLATLLLKQDDCARAMEVMHALLRRAPSAARRIDEVLPRSLPAAQLQRLQAALVKARSIHEPADAAGQFLEAKLLLLSGKNDEALALLELSMKDGASLEPAYEMLAERHCARRQWKTAVEVAQRGVDQGVKSAALQLALARAHDALDEFDAAAAAYRAAHELDHRSPAPLLALAELQERKGDLAAAGNTFQEIVEKVDPRCVEARERLIRLALQLGEERAAQVQLGLMNELGLAGPGVERSRALVRFATTPVIDRGQHFEDYVTRLKQIAGTFPDSAQTNTLLAMIHESREEYPEALACTQQALSTDPSNLLARERQVEQLTHLLRFDEAEAIMRGLLEERPNSQVWLEDYKNLALNRGDFAAGVDRLREVHQRRKEEDRLKTRLELLSLLIKLNRPDEAVHEVQSWLDAAPEDRETRVTFLWVLGKAGRHDDALATIDRWRTEGEATDYLQGQVYVHLRDAKRYEEAEQAILKWIADKPEQIGLEDRLIEVFRAAGDWDSAEELARLEGEIPEQSRKYQEVIAQIQVESRRFSPAAEGLRKLMSSARTAEEYIGHASGLIRVLTDTEDYAEAERIASEILGFEPQDQLKIGLLEQLATICERTGRQGQAIQYTETAFNLVEDLAKSLPTLDRSTIRNNLGYNLTLAGRDLERAEQLIRLAVGAAPRNAANLDSLGWVRYKRGDMREAVRFLRLAVLQSDHEDPVILDHLADALYRSDEKTEAERLWRRAEELSSPEKSTKPPPYDWRKVHRQVRRKLAQLEAGEPVKVATVIKVES